MALPGDIQIGRINRFFTKWLGTKGPSPRMSIGGELIGVIPLWSGAENRYLESWERFGQGDQSLGGAGQTAAIRLRNPSGSGVIMVVEKCLIANTNAADRVILQVFAVGVDLTTVVASTTTRLDSRGRPTPTAIFSKTVNFTLGGTPTLQTVVNTDVAWDFIVDPSQEIPLLPGDAITVQSSTVATNLVTSFIWRERAIEDSEKA
jgi:hypothetical protein